MGTTWYIADDGRRELFWLGKAGQFGLTWGGWVGETAETDGELFAVLADVMSEHVEERAAHDGPPASEHLARCVVWAAGGGPFRLVSDAWDDEPPEWIDWPEQRGLA